MRKLELGDILGPRRYEPVREELRRRIIEEKRHRRVALGERVTLVFENRRTIQFQVEEMLRAEHLTEPAAIAAELDCYNPLIPGAGELSATLLVEITDAREIRAVLNQLVGIDEHLALLVGEERIAGEFEAGRSEEERISAVQYVRFRLTPAQVAAFVGGQGEVAIAVDHPAYRARTVLAPEVRAALARDLEERGS